MRVYIDKNKGIDLEDCERVSNEINDMLDQADYIKEQYFLEVSSPGIERVLRKDKHLEQNIGRDIEIKLFRPIEGKKSYVGTLLKFDKEKIYVEINSEEKGIERKDISQVKIIFNW